MLKTTKKAADIIKEDNKLSSIIIKSQHLIKLDKILLEHIPQNMRPHCKVANLSKGLLSVYVDSATWATQLRYYIPNLILTLRTHKEFTNLISIKHHVRPSEKKIKKEITRVTPLSSDSKQSLQRMAKTMEHPELAEALNRLASSLEAN